MTRPRCRRCGLKLDLWRDHDEYDKPRWILECHGTISMPRTTDAEFHELWDNLPGDDVVRLEKWIDQYARKEQ